MRIVILTTIILATLLVSAQDKTLDSVNFPINESTNTKTSIDIPVIKNTSTNTNLNHTGEIQIKSGNKSIFEFVLPSFIALIVGFMAYWATISTSKHQRNIIKKQMDDNKLALTEQINSSLKIAELDFRKTILSSNRQVWIYDLRTVVSELISLVNVCSISSENIKDEDYKKISFLITKAEFMLNPIKDKDYIESIVKLQDSLFQLSVRRKCYNDIMADIELVKKYTKKTLKDEWERVKRGE